MTEQEWLARLDRFMALDHPPTAAEIADLVSAQMERIATVIASYTNRQHDAVQALARRLETAREREIGA